MPVDAVPDDLWERIAPLLPPRPAPRHRHPGRLPVPDRTALAGKTRQRRDGQRQLAEHPALAGKRRWHTEVTSRPSRPTTSPGCGLRGRDQHRCAADDPDRSRESIRAPMASPKRGCSARQLRLHSPDGDPARRPVCTDTPAQPEPLSLCPAAMDGPRAPDRRTGGGVIVDTKRSTVLTGSRECRGLDRAADFPGETALQLCPWERHGNGRMEKGRESRSKTGARSSEFRPLICENGHHRARAGVITKVLVTLTKQGSAVRNRLRPPLQASDLRFYRKLGPESQPAASAFTAGERGFGAGSAVSGGCR